MDCPRTGKLLKAVKVGGIEVDISEGCGGVWFDNRELHKFTTTSSEVGKVLAQHLKSFHNSVVNDGKRLKCPKDSDVVMMRRYYSAKQQIEIDECPACGGIWLDAGELESIHNLFPSDDGFENAQNEFIEKMMSSSEVKQHEKNHIDSIGSMKSTTRILRSIARNGYY